MTPSCPAGCIPYVVSLISSLPGLPIGMLYVLLLNLATFLPLLVENDEAPCRRWVTRPVIPFSPQLELRSGAFDSIKMIGVVIPSECLSDWTKKPWKLSSSSDDCAGDTPRTVLRSSCTTTTSCSPLLTIALMAFAMSLRSCWSILSLMIWKVTRPSLLSPAWWCFQTMSAGATS